VKSNHILRDTLDTVEEMTKLIKKSPKWKTIFKKFKGDVTRMEFVFLCPTASFFLEFSVFHVALPGWTMSL